jgi:5-methyltetrahydrofolate--homocysteine methyltransferase
MPIGALGGAGLQVFSIVRRLREELGVNTTCGASNISFGVPNRHSMNSIFLAMAAGAGMTSAILNPLHQEEMVGIKASDVLLAKDPNCARWIRRYREPTAVGDGSDGAEGARSERRRRRRG